MDDLTVDGPLVHESPVQLVQLVQICTDKISWVSDVSDVSEAREAHGFTEGSTDRLMYWPGRQVTRELRWIAGCF